MFKFITEKPLWANMLAAIALLLLMVLLFFMSLSWITGYGKSEKVPSVLGQNASAAGKILESKGFVVAFQDSAYVDSIAKQAVVKQSPEPDAIVKKGRTIYLTINRSIPPQVEMPNLIGFSIRSAEMYLQSLGLKLGVISYRPDIAKNAVLEQSIGENSVKPGDKVALGTSINLILGSGVGGGDMDVPYLVGLTVSATKNWVQTMGLSIGSIIPEGPIADTAAAFVIRQSPEPFTEAVPGQKVTNKIKAGQLLDIYISATAPAPRDTTQNPAK